MPSLEALNLITSRFAASWQAKSAQSGNIDQRQKGAGTIRGYSSLGIYEKIRAHKASMTKLPERDLKNLVVLSHLELKAVQRLLGSLRIPNPKLGTRGTDFLDIGLRMDSPDVTTRLVSTLGKEGMLAAFSEALRSYASACPSVCTWVGRGDFVVDKIPDTISKATLMHACRTAGRLRARCLRDA